MLHYDAVESEHTTTWPVAFWGFANPLILCLLDSSHTIRKFIIESMNIISFTILNQQSHFDFYNKSRNINTHIWIRFLLVSGLQNPIPQDNAHQSSGLNKKLDGTWTLGLIFSKGLCNLFLTLWHCFTKIHTFIMLVFLIINKVN